MSVTSPVRASVVISGSEDLAEDDERKALQPQLGFENPADTTILERLLDGGCCKRSLARLIMRRCRKLADARVLRRAYDLWRAGLAHEIEHVYVAGAKSSTNPPAPRLRLPATISASFHALPLSDHHFSLFSISCATFWNVVFLAPLLHIEGLW